MEQYTTSEQTAKLIELEIYPKHIKSITATGKLLLECTGYAIGDLIAILPNYIETKGATLNMYFNMFHWVVEYLNIPQEIVYQTCEAEFRDALYNMILELKDKEGI